MANIDIFGTLHNVTNEPIAEAGQVKTTKTKTVDEQQVAMTQQEVNDDLYRKDATDIYFDGGHTETIYGAVTTVQNSLNERINTINGKTAENILVDNGDDTTIFSALSNHNTRLNSLENKTVDASPTQNSDNLVKSGGVYTAIKSLNGSNIKWSDAPISPSITDKISNMDNSVAETVKFIEQALTPAQQAQARSNIGVNDIELTTDNITDETLDKTQAVINQELISSHYPTIVQLGQGSTVTSVVCNPDTYYKINSVVNTLVVTLPNLNEYDKLHSIMLSFTTGSSPNISFITPSGVSYRIVNNERFLPNCTYEVNIISDNNSWIVSLGGPDEPILKTLTYSSGLTINAEIDTYYSINGAVSTMTINLPAVAVGTRLKSCIFYFTLTSDDSSTVSVNITKTGNMSIMQFSNFSLFKGITYELNALYNGVAWVLSLNEFVERT